LIPFGRLVRRKFIFFWLASISKPFSYSRTLKGIERTRINNKSNSKKMSNGRVTSIAILIGSSASNGSKGGFDATTVPLVVWTLRERGAAEIEASSSASSSSLWKYELVYYEFLDDTARWTHLDQLLLQLCDSHTSGGGNSDSALPSIHLGSSENLESDTKHKSRLSRSQNSPSDSATKSSSNNNNNNPRVARAQKLIRSLQRFIDERLFRGDNNEITNKNGNGINAHLHLSVPVDASKVEASLSHLLVSDEGVRLAIRGDIRLSQPPIRQGLALWLQSQGLYGSSAQGAAGAMLEASLHVRPGRLNSCLTMDTTAAQAIHLLPPSNDGEAVVVGGNKHTNSLWGLLSGPCLTAMGKKQLRVWLRQPLVDLSSIKQRQEAVTQLLGMAKDSIRDGLRPFGGSGRGSSNSLGSNNLANLGPALAKYRVAEDGDNDDEPLAGRIVDTKKPLAALYHLYVLASNHLPHLLECMEYIIPEQSSAQNESSSSSQSPILSSLYHQVAQLVAELERSVGLAEAVLDLDQAPEEFLIKPEYDEELQELHRELEVVKSSVNNEHDAIQEAWNDIASSGKATQVRLERVEDNTAWQFRLPDTNDSKIVQNVGQKIKIHRILKNGVYFSSLELRQLSAKYQDLQAEYTRLSRKIVRDAMSIASTYSSVVDRASEAIGTLDVFCALAQTAAMSPHGYCKPTMTDSDEDDAGIRLEGARHPCVELQESMEYIPNDIDLTFPQAQLLVSGPNMGGKSVYIRSLGAIVCMAQIGSYVPCTSATINICHSILARVGAGDLQERGISTFMAEMLESSAILRAATKRSLIIIDELGRGTSTFDGYGLARAILEYLMDRVGCMVVFATHFHELTHLPGVRNCHVTAQKGSQGLTFLYQVRPGPCLESFGIQVAEMAHVPKAVIEDAKKRARELENFVDAGATGDSGNGDAGGVGTNKRLKTSKKNRKMLQQFARLDLPAIMKEVSTLTPEAKQAKLSRMLVSP
jgi:DNA mismatch repair protein MSH2